MQYPLVLIAALFLSLGLHAQQPEKQPVNTGQTAGNPMATKVLVSEISKTKDVSWPRIDSAVLAGADVNAKAQNNWTALMYAAYDDKPATARLLIDHGADVNARDNFGTTVLIWAAGRQFELVKMLVDHGADVNAKGYDGETALIRATVRASQDSAVKLLLAHGADVNARTKNGATALINAAGYGYMAMAKMLLEHGADVNAKDKYGKAAIHWAFKEEMKQLLRSYGAKQ